MRTLSAFALLSAVIFGQMPPAGPPQSQPPVQASTGGFISGRVVDAVSGKPIAEAMVMLNGRAAFAQGAAAAGGRGGAPTPPLIPVLTDSQGRFFFSSLVPGTYSALLQKTGYAPAPPVLIELSADERVLDWRLKLAKLSSLAGTLRDEAGDPAVGVDVAIFRRSLMNGRQTWMSGGRQRTDDRGAYRFTGLLAGDFVLCACGRDPIPFDPLLLTTLGSEPVQLMTVAARALTLGSDAVSVDNSLRTWAPAFYPNSPSLARATRITLASGEDKTGLDMNLALTRSTRVSGRIVGAEGAVQANSIRLIPDADVEAGIFVLTMSPMLVQPDGRFDFTMVPPGQYRLVVVHRPAVSTGGPSGAALAFAGARGITPPPPGATMASAGLQSSDPTQWANELITVGENGVSGLNVTLNRSATVAGRVEWIGAAPQPQPNVYNRLTVPLSPINPADPMAQSSFTSGRFSPDGTFLIAGAVPGKYSLDFRPLPTFPSLKSVTMGGVDITDLPIMVAEKDLAGIVMTYTDAPMASLTINLDAISAAAGSTGDDGSILVFTADRKYWTETTAARRRFRQMAIPSKNTVTTPDVPAGDYLVVVATALEAADWMEAGKLEQFARRAQRVTVGENGKVSVEVRR